MVGFSSTDLSSLIFATKASISTLGALTEWTYSVQFFSGVYQVNIFYFINNKFFLTIKCFMQFKLNAFATPLTTYINNYLNGNITTSFLTSTGNLLCSLSNLQILSISQANFA